jgi:hypothetical protein
VVAWAVSRTSPLAIGVSTTQVCVWAERKLTCRACILTQGCVGCLCEGQLMRVHGLRVGVLVRTKTGLLTSLERAGWGSHFCLCLDGCEFAAYVYELLYYCCL